MLRLHGRNVVQLHPCVILMIRRRVSSESQTTDKNHVAVDTTGRHQERQYYKEFMKLIKRQKEHPFLFTTKNIQQVDLSCLASYLEEFEQNKQTNKSFGSLGVAESLLKKLSKEGIKKPLSVQSKALPVLFRGKNVIVTSSTGSGKTLTYLLPIIQNIGANACANVIIVPTRELASQVYREALKYVEDKSLVSRHVSGINAEHEKKLSHALKDSKILIGTPKKLLEIVESNLGHFRKVKCIVLDEVDKLLPYGKLRSRQSKMRSAKPKPSEKLLSVFTYYQKNVQIVAVSATVSKTLKQELQDMGLGKECRFINTIPDQFSHGEVPQNIQHFCSVYQDLDEESKYKCIARLFEHSKEESTLVFIPRFESVEIAVNAFKEIGFTATALYKELLLPAPNSYDNFLKAFEKGDVQFVVATEETVRGMDFPFLKSMYISYVPENQESYVHVAGRVGRLDKPGRIVTVVAESTWSNEKKRFRKILSSLERTLKFIQL